MSVVQEAYNQWSTSYDHDLNFTRDLDAQVTREALAKQQWGAVLELGCGTGKNTVLLAEIAQTVQAFDFSPEMMAQAQAKVAAGNVQFTQTDLTQTWPYPDHTADLIICNLVLEHIEDLDFIFAEAQRVLAENGRFFISELHPFKQYQGKQAVFERDGMQTKVPAFIHHVSDFWQAGIENGLQLVELGEKWHEQDDGKPPRLITLMFAWVAHSEA